MSRSGRTLSFKLKLSLALTGLGVATAAGVCTLLITIHYVGARDLALEALATQAEVIAVHSEAALSFDDQAVGRETLAALREDPGVVWAAIYDADAALFAAYRRGEAPAPPPTLPASAWLPSPGGDLLLVADAVTQEGRRLGTVVAAYDTGVVYEQLWQDITLSLLATAAVAATAAALALRLRRLLTRPMGELVRTARHVSRTHDYTARARKHTQDEFGDLTDTFNAMLDRIQTQTDELQRRNQEMQQFLYTVSHDLKSPLVTLTGFVGILQEDLAQQRYDQVDESLGHLSRASRRMGRLIDDLLALSRIGRVQNQLEWVDAGELVREIVADLGPRAEAVSAIINVQPYLPRVVADRHRLAQVFENLLTNAIKYGVADDAASIEVGGRREGGEIRYFVRDHGPGIPPEYRKRVFVLFQRLHSSEEGTGIGLTIAMKILEAHGGRIWFEPTPGGGATFWIALPAEPPADFT